MPRILHFGFKFVWIVSALAFGWFATDAYHAQFTTLPRYELPKPNLPSGVTVRNVIGGVDFQAVITGIAESHNRTVSELQASIRSSAKLAFKLNLMCCFAALVGFATQFGQYRHDEAQKAKRQNVEPKDDEKEAMTIPNLKESEDKHEDPPPA